MRFEALSRGSRSAGVRTVFRVQKYQMFLHSKKTFMHFPSLAMTRKARAQTRCTGQSMTCQHHHKRRAVWNVHPKNMLHFVENLNWFKKSFFCPKLWQKDICRGRPARSALLFISAAEDDFLKSIHVPFVFATLSRLRDLTSHYTDTSSRSLTTESSFYHVAGLSFDLCSFK